MKKSILFSLALIGLTSTPSWAMDPQAIEGLEEQTLLVRDTDGNNALTRADNAEAVRTVLANKHMNETAFSNQNDKNETALIRRANADDLESVKVLLAYQLMNRTVLAKQDDTGKNALMHAAANNNVEIIKALLASNHMSKSIIEQKDNAKNNALVLAINTQSENIVQAFLNDPRVDEAMIPEDKRPSSNTFNHTRMEDLIHRFLVQETLRKKLLVTDRQPPFGSTEAMNKQIINISDNRRINIDMNQEKEEVFVSEIKSRYGKKFEMPEKEKQFLNKMCSKICRNHMIADSIASYAATYISLKTSPQQGAYGDHTKYKEDSIKLFERAARARKLAEKELDWAKSKYECFKATLISLMGKRITGYAINQYILRSNLAEDFSDMIRLNEMWNLKLDIPK